MAAGMSSGNRMARRQRRRRWDWLNNPLTTREESPPWVRSQFHSLSHATVTGTISSRLLPQFQRLTGLADFAWRVYYHRRPAGRVQPVTHLFTRAQGYVIFMHGWGGSHAVWEDIPAIVCQANPHLVCLAPDVNGFGGSPFIEAKSPLLELCGPRGNMQAVELWLDLLKLHRTGHQRQAFTFVGHSMSGASLFHKTQRGWSETRYSLLALAPAMLHKDTIKKALYKTLGVGIGAGVQYGFLDTFKGRLAVSVTELLASNASQAVKDEHVRIFQQTDKGTVAQVFYALGLAEEIPPPRDWGNVFVMLGHKDRLVALGPTLDLLENMGLHSWNLDVMLGDHYFFSVSQQSRRLHSFNRDELLRHILRLHDEQHRCSRP
ncbi:MAG: alpha/beta hydrolase [Anaerolineae bacterium]|nr:alpha/beta hydrolase [Anaerolineae bacterium]